MKFFVLLNTLLTTLMARFADANDDRERGDVPGWVMITMMTSAHLTLASTGLLFPGITRFLQVLNPI